MIFFPPMNGGLPTKASNPPRFSKTSGNSSGQWNVGCSFELLCAAWPERLEGRCRRSRRPRWSRRQRSLTCQRVGEQQVGGGAEFGGQLRGRSAAEPSWSSTSSTVVGAASISAICRRWTACRTEVLQGSRNAGAYCVSPRSRLKFFNWSSRGCRPANRRSGWRGPGTRTACPSPASAATATASPSRRPAGSCPPRTGSAGR